MERSEIDVRRVANGVVDEITEIAQIDAEPDVASCHAHDADAGIYTQVVVRDLLAALAVVTVSCITPIPPDR